MSTNIEWISVIDKLPRPGERVLAYAIKYDYYPWLDASFFEAHCDEGGGWKEEVDGCFICVTHWIPLPPPPK